VTFISRSRRCINVRQWMQTVGVFERSVASRRVPLLGCGRPKGVGWGDRWRRSGSSAPQTDATGLTAIACVHVFLIIHGPPCHRLRFAVLVAVLHFVTQTDLLVNRQRSD
jgi:hypothetical protein